MLLLLICTISWGAHFARNSFPIFGAFYLVDRSLMTPMGLGVLLGLSSVPSTFLPLIAGHMADNYLSVSFVMEVFLLLTIIGQVFLTISCALESYAMICLSMIIFGCGTSSVTSLQRSMIPIYLPRRESFSIGVSVAAAHIAKMAGKLYVVPLSEYMESYIVAMLFNVCICILSWLLFRFTIMWFGEHSTGHRIEIWGRNNNVHLVASDDQSSDENPTRVESSIRLCILNLLQIPVHIYILIMLHGLYLISFHVFLNFFPDIGRVHWKVDRQTVVFLSCLPSVVVLAVAPVVGMLADLTKQAKIIFLISSIFIASIYELMIYDLINGFLAMLFLSIFQCIITTLTLAMICKMVPFHLNAMIFGIIEVVDSVGSIVFNISFGYLYDVKFGYQFGLVFISIVYWLGSSLVFYWFLTVQVIH